MTEKLSRMFDGELHWLEPGEYFPTNGVDLRIKGWEIGEEEDILSPFESPTQEPILEQGWKRSEELQKLFPMADTEQAWGALSINLSCLATIMGFTKKQYQHVWPGPGAVQGQIKWSFQTDQPITERL